MAGSLPGVRNVVKRNGDTGIGGHSRQVKHIKGRIGELACVYFISGVLIVIVLLSTAGGGTNSPNLPSPDRIYARHG